MKESEVMAALYALLHEPRYRAVSLEYRAEYDRDGATHWVNVYGLGPDKRNLYGRGSTLSAALRQALCVDPVTGNHRSLGPDVDAMIARLEGEVLIERVKELEAGAADDVDDELPHNFIVGENKEAE